MKTHKRWNQRQREKEKERRELWKGLFMTNKLSEVAGIYSNLLEEWCVWAERQQKDKRPHV